MHAVVNCYAPTIIQPYDTPSNLKTITMIDKLAALKETPIHPHLTGNDKGLYATMNRWRIDPSSYPDVCSVDDMGVCSAFEILTFSETFLPFSLHFQNKSLSLQPT